MRGSAGRRRIRRGGAPESDRGGYVNFSAFETAGKTASSPRAESYASAAQRPPASASIPAYLQAGNPTEVLGVSGHEGRIVDDRCCRDQKVHRGDRPAAAAQRGQKPRVGWRESFVRVAHDEAATEPPNTLPLDGGTLRALRTREQLAHDVDSDAYLFTRDLLEEHRGRSTDTARRIAEEIDQERSIRVDHSLMRRAGLDRRAFTSESTASSVRSERRARATAARRSSPVPLRPRRCLIV